MAQNSTGAIKLIPMTMSIESTALRNSASGSRSRIAIQRRTPRRQTGSFNVESDFFSKADWTYAISGVRTQIETGGAFTMNGHEGA